MTAPSHPRRATSTAFLSIAITVSATACAGFSLGGKAGSSPGAPGSASESAPASASPSPQSAGSTSTGATPAGPEADAFIGLTEERNIDNARKFKEELRSGLLTRIFDGTVLADEVAAICGVKIWDQCEVARSAEPNDLGWPEWTFRRKDADTLYRYPDIFYAKAEPRWSAMAVDYILTSDSGPALVKLVQDKCGTTFTDGCQVRQRHGAGYVLTVKRDGEVIHVMDTLTQWRRDL